MARGFSVTEMSMGTVMDNEVRDARGIGIWCNDRSMCMIEKNTVLDTRPDATGNAFGVLASFQSEANLWKNELGANPVPVGRGHQLGRRPDTLTKGDPLPHIDLPEGVPGIRSAMAFRPETAGPLCALAETLLRDDNTLSRGERELIAAYVSSLNDCFYCQTTHSATFAAMQLDGVGWRSSRRSSAILDAGAGVATSFRRYCSR